MKRAPSLHVTLAALTVAMLAFAGAVGCGGGAGKDSGGETKNELGDVSPLDAGPRAGDAPTDTALATTGAALFRSKSCTACHAYGKRLTGPDLKGVTRRRTAAWMEHQILHPDSMVTHDPLSRKLFHQYGLRMTNQGLTPEEARAIIEHFKRLDAEAESRGERLAP